MVDDSRTVNVVDFDGVQLISKDSCTRRLLCFDDILDFLYFLFVPANDPKAVDASSVSGDGNTTPAGLVARRSHFILNELAKCHWCSLSDVFLWHPGRIHRAERRLRRRRPTCGGGRAGNADRRGHVGRRPHTLADPMGLLELSFMA